MDFNAIWERLQRAVKLEQGVYAEIANDNDATGQSIVLSIVATAIAGLGAIWPGGADFGLVGWIVGSAVGGVVGLVIGAGILWLISRLFNGQGSYISMLRVLGFSQAPQALGIIPVVGSLVGWIWALVLTVRAVRESQSVSEGAAWAIVLIPVAIAIILGFLVFAAVMAALFGFAAAS